MQTCPCSLVVNALGRQVQWSVTHLKSWGSNLGAGFFSFRQGIIPNTSNAHDEQGDNPGQEKGARWCPLQSVIVAE